MTKHCEEFLKLLEADDKEACVNYAASRLASGELDIVSLYENVLAPALVDMKCPKEEAHLCVWKEHIRSAIVRTIIEGCYPHLLKERDRNHGGRKGIRVAVVCPTEEYHELGARMVADFMTLLGYDVTFVGANTPLPDFLAAVEHDKPAMVLLSVSNYYNLVAAKKVVQEIRKRVPKGIRIIVGGNAFAKNPDAWKELGADELMRTFEDLKRLAGAKS